MSGYLLVFEIISVHLVVVLVGAAYLARARKRPAAQLAPTPSGSGGRVPRDVKRPLPVGK
jgi:hypothetical protein